MKQQRSTRTSRLQREEIATQMAVRQELTDMKVLDGMTSQSQAEVVQLVGDAIPSMALFRRSRFKREKNLLRVYEASPSVVFGRLHQRVATIREKFQRLIDEWERSGGTNPASKVYWVDYPCETRFGKKLRAATKAIDDLLDTTTFVSEQPEQSGRHTLDHNYFRDRFILLLYALFFKALNSKSEAEIRAGTIGNHYLRMRVDVRPDRENENSRGCDAVAKILTRRKRSLPREVLSALRVTNR